MPDHEPILPQELEPANLEQHVGPELLLDLAPSDLGVPGHCFGEGRPEVQLK